MFPFFLALCVHERVCDLPKMGKIISRPVVRGLLPIFCVAFFVVFGKIIANLQLPEEGTATTASGRKSFEGSPQREREKKKEKVSW